MKYKLNPELRKIQSPITLIIGDEHKKYINGTSLTEDVFGKRYVISSIRAIENVIEIELEEAAVNAVNWTGEEQTFF